jgi:hypothetical protein
MRKRRIRALTKVENGIIGNGSLVAAIESVVEGKDRDRARRHRRPAPRPSTYDALRPHLGEAERRVADRLVELHAAGTIARQKVVAAYQAAAPGTGGSSSDIEMTDRKAAAWTRYTLAVRAIPEPVRPQVLDVVLFDRPADPAEVAAGLVMAARTLGFSL